ncbi:MAG: carbohydrate ABC transporter permease [Clostridiaceae bacterium]|nr:carbohydrate ABC transporter permease [Clostridiaceae bacterium]
MIGYQNTFFYTIVGTFLNLAVTLPAAYTLSKPDLPGRGFLMGFFMFTMYFSGGMIPTYLLVKACNLLDTRWVLLITGLISVYNMIVCRTFFQRLPVELEEAAMIDGSSALHTFIRIVLPLSKALMGVMVLYYGVAHWNSYFSAMIYISDTSKWPLQLFLRRILILSQTSEEMYDEQALISKEYMKTLIKYAVIIVSSAPVLIIYPFLQKYFDKGVLLGSVKG